MRGYFRVWTGQELAFDHPFNAGAHCAKGASVREHGHGERRLKYPTKLENGQWKRISWEQAIEEIGDRVLEIRARSGPDAVFWLGSAKFNNEQAYLFRKLAALLGTNNVDHQARICHSTIVAGVANTWGYGAMTNSYNDIHNSKAMLIIGGNPAEAHPVSLLHIFRAKERNHAPLIVIDFRVLSHSLPGYYGLSEGAWKHWCRVWDLDYAWVAGRFDQGSYEESQGKPAKPMNTKGIPVSRWIDGVLEDKANIAQQDNFRAVFMWGHAPNSQTRGPEMKQAREQLDLLVVVDPYPTVSAVMHDRSDGIYLLPAATQFETYGSVTVSNHSLHRRALSGAGFAGQVPQGQRPLRAGRGLQHGLYLRLQFSDRDAGNQGPRCVVSAALDEAISVK